MLTGPKLQHAKSEDQSSRNVFEKHSGIRIPFISLGQDSERNKHTSTGSLCRNAYLIGYEVDFSLIESNAIKNEYDGEPFLEHIVERASRLPISSRSPNKRYDLRHRSHQFDIEKTTILVVHVGT